MSDFLYDVFLGGSCGITTWRYDVTIPRLKQIGISFYNPQRNEWTEDMIKAEEFAKSHSRLLLFVIDARQVSLVSLIEISFLAAKGAPLIVVLPSDDEISGYLNKDFSYPRHRDRLRTFAFVRNVLQRHKIPQFKHLDDAMNFIEHIIIGERRLSDIIIQPKCLRFFCAMTASKIYQQMNSCGLIASSSLSFNNLKQTLTDPKVLKFLHPQCRSDWLKLNLLFIELLLFFTLCFCCSALPVVLILGFVIIVHFFVLVLFPIQLLPKDKSRQLRRTPSPATYDVYLGSSGSRKEWIKQIATPILNKHGLSYMDSTYCDFAQRVTVLPHCQYVFYVVACMESLKSGLVEMSYYVGSGYKVVGCIAVAIPSPKCSLRDLEDSGLTANAAECYRRGLLYLKDMAASSHVTVMDDVKLALDYLVKQVRDESSLDVDRSPFR